MRRIYLEYLIGLMAIFVISIKMYGFIVYEMSTDYEYLLRDHEAEAFQQLIMHISDDKGVPETEQILSDYADKTRQIITSVPFQKAPSVVQTAFNEGSSHIFYYQETDLWFRLKNSDKPYEIKADKETFLRKQIRFENKLIWVFALAGFALSGLFLVWRINKRLRNLEQVTVSFAKGELQARASERNAIKLGTLNRSFNIMANKICDLINSNKSLTNAVAHELRTPIFRIQWQADLLSDSQLTDAQMKSLSRIIADTEEMEDMVDELLHYARLERSDYELTKQSLDVNNWLSERQSMWKKETSLDIDIIELKTAASLYVDLRLFNRAVDNIVRNAFKFSDSKIVIELWQNESEVVIEIHDDGKGIESEHWPYLFDPFYSVNAARNKGKTGHGLGLAIVKQVCERHQARVTAGESYLGGACFALTFPLGETELPR